MIFVVVGSQKFQFNRLLKYLDTAVENGIIKDKVFAQTGYSTYKPQNYEYKDFIDRDRYKEILKESDIVICHGGTGVIVEAAKLNKKVIACARLSAYDEHVDDHQIQIIDQFEEASMIIKAEDVSQIGDIINKIDTYELKSYVSHHDKIINFLKEYISRC